MAKRISVDRILFVVTLLLVFAGLVMVFSASAVMAKERYHSGYFSHIFESGYSAGYYAYLWSEVLARDTGQWFAAQGGLTRANGDYLRSRVLSRGRSADPQQLFHDFYGRDPEIAPLLEYRGLAGGS